MDFLEFYSKEQSRGISGLCSSGHLQLLGFAPCCLTKEGAPLRNMVFHPSLAVKQFVFSSQSKIQVRFTGRLFQLQCSNCLAGQVALHGDEKQGRNAGNSGFASDALWPGESKSAPDQTALIRTHLWRSCNDTIASRRVFFLGFVRHVYLTKRSFSRLAVCLGRTPSCPSFFPELFCRIGWARCR